MVLPIFVGIGTNRMQNSYGKVCRLIKFLQSWLMSKNLPRKRAWAWASYLGLIVVIRVCGCTTYAYIRRSVVDIDIQTSILFLETSWQVSAVGRPPPTPVDGSASGSCATSPIQYYSPRFNPKLFPNLYLALKLEFSKTPAKAEVQHYKKSTEGDIEFHRTP